MPNREAPQEDSERPGQTGDGTPAFAGRKKGGTRFPRIALEQALQYSKKLVSKTAVAPQQADAILAGVFNNKGTMGEIRASALKQYGLMEGPSSAYKATQLARDIDAAADETERLP